MTFVSEATSITPFAKSDAVTRTMEITVAAYGLVIITIFQMPIFELTALGGLIRYLEIAVGLSLFAVCLPTVMSRFTAGETAFLLSYLVILLVSTLSGIFGGVNPEPGALVRQAGLSVLVYSVAKLLVSEEGFERYLRWYFYLCMFAALQSIVAIGAEIYGLRRIYEIILPNPGGGQFYLSWGGFLGIDGHNFRTNFYFSEDSHFAHMLLPGIVYAFARQYALSLFILLVAFLTTSAAFASGILILILLIGSFRFGIDGKIGAALAGFGVIVAGAILVLLSTSVFIVARFLVRDTSINSKVETARYIFVQLENYPFGLGPVNLPAHFGESGLNSSNGMFVIAANYGFPGLVLLAVTGIYLLVLVFKPGVDKRVAATALGVGAIMAATFSHGPTFKYYVIFMLSALNSFRLILIDRASGQRTPS